MSGKWHNAVEGTESEHDEANDNSQGLMADTFFNSVASLFSTTDEQAMWRVKMEDDPQAFARLVSRWEKPIQSLCFRMIGDAHRSEDLTQEAFTRVFARRKDYEASGKFSTFLWRVALNLCHDELRKISRRRESTLDGDGDDDAGAAGVMDESAGPDLRLVEQERAEMVRRAMLQLSEPYRAVVALRHYEGLKFREIGEVLEIPEGTVKSRMSEALSVLNQILSRSLNEKETVCKPIAKQRQAIPAII